MDLQIQKVVGKTEGSTALHRLNNAMSGKLLLMLEGHLIGEYLLDRGSLTIGRHPDNDIQIENPIVSRYHAKIVSNVDGHDSLQDMDSANGSYVNGQRVKSYTLKDGEVFQIGKHQLKYIKKSVESGGYKDTNERITRANCATPLKDTDGTGVYKDMDGREETPHFMSMSGIKGTDEGSSVGERDANEVINHTRSTHRIKNTDSVLKNKLSDESSGPPHAESRLNPPLFSQRDQTTPEIYFSEFLGTLVDSRWFIAKIVLFVLLIGTAHIYIAAPIYRTDALLKVEHQSVGIGALDEFAGFSNLFKTPTIRSEIEILTSRSILGPVVENLQLDIIAQAAHFPIVGSALARMNDLSKGVVEPWFYLSKYAWGSERIKIETFEIPDSYLGTEFTVVTGNDSHYELYDEDSNLLGKGKVGDFKAIPLPDNGLISLTISKLRARPGTHFKLIKMPRLKAINELKEKLTIKEQGQDYKDEESSSGLAQIILEGPSPEHISSIVNEIVSLYVKQIIELKSSKAMTTLKLLKEQLGAIKLQLENAEEALSNYRLKQGSVDLPKETQVVLENIVETEARIARLRETRQELMQKFTTSHPKLIALDAQIAASAQKLKSYESRVKALPDTQQEILRLSREVEITTQLYTMLLKKFQKLNVVKAGTRGKVRVIDKAAIPYEPVKPKKPLIFALYLLLGGMLGVGIAILRNTLLGGVKDPNIVEKEVGLPVYAMVPHSRKQKIVRVGTRHKYGMPPILAAAVPKDPAIESLRSLRTSLQFALLEAKNNVIMITSPGPNDGKSFISINLGAVLESMDKRVLVIDGDLRKGYLHKAIGIERREGLADVIAGDIGIERVIRASGVNNLFVITTGTLPPNPSELLLHERLAFNLEQIASHFDYVIIDTPPILAVTDAATISCLAGATFLVVKSGEHPIRELDHCIKRLRQAGGNVRGVVFNEIQASSGRYSYGKYYGYDYSYSGKGK